MNMVDLKKYNEILPKFPRTSHAPIEPNASRDDLIFDKEEFYKIINNKNNHIDVSEKLDGANSAIVILDDEPVIRNRNHILSKNYSGAKTPAKMQFSPIWTWFYENKDKFVKLEKILGFLPCVYGEWLYALHSIPYDALPSWFIAFDVYDFKNKKYISPKRYRPALIEAGFEVVPELKVNGFTEKDLKQARDGKSMFSENENKEGIYLKFCDGDFVCERLKMVRPGFIQGDHWNKSFLTKNKKIK